MSPDQGEPTLEGVLGAIAAELGLRGTDDGSATTWSRADRAFANLGPAGAEFRLDGPLAVAARRTPDTSSSDRGPEWVRFAPRVLDGMAIDRARAWFEAAFRRAG